MNRGAGEGNPAATSTDRPDPAASASSRAAPAAAQGPLRGIRVIDLSRLAPGPYCTMLLADLGAEVIVVGGGRAGVPIPELSRGKRFMSLDLKSDAGRLALHALVKSADVVVEGFRPGVADRLGAGYVTLSAVNPRIVYCSITGYGQDGPRARDAGHDINYIAVSGLLAALGGVTDQPPRPPLNLVADFAGGSLVAVVGILAALLESRMSGRGQLVDAAMLDGSLSMMAMHLPLWRTQHWPTAGQSLLDGSKPFYRSYVCSDGKFVAVGALERGFFEALWRSLALGDVPDHMNTANWPQIESQLAAAFRGQPREHWAKLFQGTDACVTPVLEPDEVWTDPQTASRHPSGNSRNVPAIPRLSRTPATARPYDLSDQTSVILGELGFDDKAIEAAVGQAGGVISGLEWPPPLR
jgi:alpha-methylacyl-CoA racemase